MRDLKVESDFEMETSLAFWNQTLSAIPLQENELHCSLVPKSFEMTSELEKDETTCVESSEDAETKNMSSPGFSDIKSLLDQDFNKVSVTEESAVSKTSTSCMKRGSRKRKDVVLKTVLRKCRKYLQQRLVSLTGFVCSKKIKEDDPLLPSLEKLLEEMP